MIQGIEQFELKISFLAFNFSIISPLNVIEINFKVLSKRHSYIFKKALKAFPLIVCPYVRRFLKSFYNISSI
jgi:hypothetical protein